MMRKFLKQSIRANNSTQNPTEIAQMKKSEIFANTSITLTGKSCLAVHNRYAFHRAEYLKYYREFTPTPSETEGTVASSLVLTHSLDY